MLELHGHELSGNTYKIKLLLSLLGLEYKWIAVDLLKGDHKKPEFLALNPFGQVPVLVDREIVLADAQGILVYLARQYGGEEWLPLEAVPLAQVMRWLSVATGEVRQGAESARLYHLFNAKTINIDRAHQKAEFILSQLDRHLSENRDWLECDRPTIADIAIFPYIALAPDGKISLDPYPFVRAWIDRMKTLPGFVGMPGIEESLAT